MEAIAHDPAFAARAGVSQSTGREFVAADKSQQKPVHPRIIAAVLMRRPNGGA